MTRPPTRARRETAEAPRGIGGVPPYPLPGPITAFRVLGHGFEVTLDPARKEQLIGRDGPPNSDIKLPLPSISRVHAMLSRPREGVLEVTDQGSRNGIGFADRWSRCYVRCEVLGLNIGDRFKLGSVPLLALDDQTHKLAKPLTEHFGPGAHEEVDHALEAIANSHMLNFYGQRGDQVVELARTLHEHSMRKDYPFTQVNAVPETEAAITELCTQAGCGTIFLDLTKPFHVPPQFARNLVSDYFHLWPITVTSAPDEIYTRFRGVFSGATRAGFALCSLGFPAQALRLNVGSATFT